MVPSARSIVLVKRSGIDIKRFAPSPLSLRNPPTMVRLARSSDQTASTLLQSQPHCFMDAVRLPYISCVNTEPTTASLSPGDSMNPSTSAMSLAYSGSGWVRKYSNGLLLIAARFHESVETSQVPFA